MWPDVCISHLLISPPTIPYELICIRIHLLSKHAQSLRPVTALGKQGGRGEEHLFASSW